MLLTGQTKGPVKLIKHRPVTKRPLFRVRRAGWITHQDVRRISEHLLPMWLYGRPYPMHIGDTD